MTDASPVGIRHPDRPVVIRKREIELVQTQATGEIIQRNLGFTDGGLGRRIGIGDVIVQPENQNDDQQDPQQVPG